MTTIDIEQARSMLKDAFPMTEKVTQKMAVYKNQSGREIALQRERINAYYLWLERYDVNLDHVSVKNLKNPGQAYDRKQPRSSNLNDTSAPRLKLGNKVWHLEVDNTEALTGVISWYKNN